MEPPILTRIRITDMPEIGAHDLGQCVLVTRDLGKTVRSALEKHLARSHGGLCLDFSGVVVIDFGCAEEIVCKLVSKVIADVPGKYIVLEHLEVGPKENIREVMEGQRLSVLYRTPEGGWECLGLMQKSWIPVFERVVANGYGDAGTIAGQLAIPVTRVTPSLRRLSVVRLLWQQEPPTSGLQPLYELVGGKDGKHIRDLA
ncbi:MAG: hypothetical protein Q7S16_02895 [bacterium]|nr:hypothetical protein [bacterium]